MKRIGIWLRVSTEDQARGESPEHHEKRGRMYAEVREWEVAEIYHLEGVSGKSILGHSETQRMMHDIKRGHIEGLIFSKLARLARNTRELLELADFFKDNDADLISIQEAIDTSTPMGRLFYTLSSAFAQFEREEIAERVAASVPIRAKLGKPLGGAAPFGYAWEDKQLVLNEREAPIRQLMYDLFLQHKRKTTVVNMLNEMGHRTRKGSKFTKTTLTRLLEDPIAKGLRRANYTKSVGQGKKWLVKAKEDWIFHPAPILISEETWDSVQVLLGEQSTIKTQRLNRKSHLFTKVIQCHCEGKMYMEPVTEKYVCQTCRNKMVAKDLEEIFHEQLTDYILSNDSIKEQLSESSITIKQKERELETTTSKISQHEVKIQHLLALHETKQIPTEGFGELYNPVFEQLTQLRNTKVELEGEIAALRELQASSEYMFKEAQSLYEKWHDFTHDEKREIINTIVKSITIGEQQIDIKLLYLIPPRLPFDLFRREWGTNPCPCGFYNHPEKECQCAPGVVQRYLNKISGPLMDRIDLHVEVTPLPVRDLSSTEEGERSELIRERVIKARDIQEERFAGSDGVYSNAQMSSKQLREVCKINAASAALLNKSMEKLGLSARAYDRILKVSRTIADLADCENIQVEHLAEAIQYRSLDRDSWAG